MVLSASHTLHKPPTSIVPPSSLKTRLWSSLPKILQQRVKTLRRLPLKSVAHDHIRLIGTGLIARIPRDVPPDKTPLAALTYQATCFEYAQNSLHTPYLHEILPPSEILPLGALLVSDIRGRPPHSPQDFSAIAITLSVLHTLPIPSESSLITQNNPLHIVLTLLKQRWPDIQKLPKETISVLKEEIKQTKDLFSHLSHRSWLPICFVGTDTHPGNFLIDVNGKAWFTDLEKAAFGLPTIDLAHSTLYTSTFWAIKYVLSQKETDTFYRIWLDHVPCSLRKAAIPWVTASRRLTWLRTLSWMAHWRNNPSVKLLPRNLQKHIATCLKDFFLPATMNKIRQEWSK